MLNEYMDTKTHKLLLYLNPLTSNFTTINRIFFILFHSN
jgi:hypothetical protein